MRRGGSRTRRVQRMEEKSRMSGTLAEVLSFILRFVLTAAIGCAAYSHSALSAPVPVWAVFNSENSDLPSDQVLSLALGADGSHWVGTARGGLVRFDTDGHWQTYSKASTNGGREGIQSAKVSARSARILEKTLLGPRGRQLTRASFCSERSSWSGFLPNNCGQ